MTRTATLLAAVASLVLVPNALLADREKGDGGHTNNEAVAINSGIYDSMDGVEFEAPEPGTYKLPPIKFAGDGDVITHKGRPIRLKELMRGRITILSFIYTSCDDVKGCPLATAKLFDLHDASMEDQDLAKHARLVTLSFDPEHDTPEVMKSYGYAALADENKARKMSWHFLTTSSHAQIEPILARYGQVIDRRGTGSAISHLLRVYLIDRKGQIRNIYGLGFLDQRLLIADIKTLLMEEATLGNSAVR